MLRVPAALVGNLCREALASALAAEVVGRHTEGFACYQGPVEHIWVTEVSFGRTKSAKKLVKGVARFWSTFRLKLPLTIRGLQIELREGNDLPAWAARCARQSPALLM